MPRFGILNSVSNREYPAIACPWLGRWRCSCFANLFPLPCMKTNALSRRMHAHPKSMPDAVERTAPAIALDVLQLEQRTPKSLGKSFLITHAIKSKLGACDHSLCGSRPCPWCGPVAGTEDIFRPHNGIPHTRNGFFCRRSNGESHEGAGDNGTRARIRHRVGTTHLSSHVCP